MTVVANDADCRIVHGSFEMLPTNSIAISVPAMAVLAPEAISLDVSVRAAPIEVRFSGNPRIALLPETTPTIRMPNATITNEQATQM